MAKQVQDAYIVAATRTPVGKAPRGMFRNTRPDDLPRTREGAMKQARGSGRRSGRCHRRRVPGGRGMNVARIGLLLAGFPNMVSG